MKVALFDKKGKKTDTKITLSKEIFEAKINEPLMAQAVYIYLGNQRQSNAHTKTRAEVSGGGKKPWKQKGTGRARHGSTRSPIWTGGGVTFGPRNTRNYKKTLSKQMRKKAILSILSKRAADKNITVFSEYEVLKEKLTQGVIKVLKNAKLEGKTLFIQNTNNKEFVKAVSNLPKVKVILATELNTYTLMNYTNIVLSKDVLTTLDAMWGVKKEVTSNKSKK